MKQYIEEAEKVLMHTYSRYPVVLDHGKECTFMISRVRNTWIYGRNCRVCPGIQQ